MPGVFDYVKNNPSGICKMTMSRVLFLARSNVMRGYNISAEGEGSVRQKR